jgi:hypothetical protein
MRICRRSIFFPTSRLTQEREKRKYRQATYKIRRWVFFVLRVAQVKKAKDFWTDELHTRVCTWKPLSPPRKVVCRHKKGTWEWRNEKDQGRREGGFCEGNVPCDLQQEFLFLVHEYSGSERPVSFEYRLLRDLVYEEAMCEGSSGNGLPYAARAVP